MSNFTTDRLDFATTRTYCEVSPLTQVDRTAIAQVKTWDMCAGVQAHEVIRIAVTNGIVQVKLTGGRAALLSVNTFKLILELSRQQVNEDVAYIEQLEQKLEQDSNGIKVACINKIYHWGKGFNYSVRFPQWVEIGRAQVVKGKLLSGFRAMTIAQNALAQLSTSDKAQEVAA